MVGIYIKKRKIKHNKIYAGSTHIHTHKKNTYIDMTLISFCIHLSLSLGENNNNILYFWKIYTSHIRIHPKSSSKWLKLCYLYYFSCWYFFLQKPEREYSYKRYGAFEMREAGFFLYIILRFDWVKIDRKQIFRIYDNFVSITTSI